MTNHKIEQEISELKNIVDRISAEIPLLALKRNSLPVSIPKDNIKDLIDTLRRDYSEYFRNCKEPKKELLPQIISVSMAVIAIISAMTAILTPMNADRDRMNQQIEKIEAKVDALISADSIDKSYNGKIDIMYSQLEKHLDRQHTGGACGQ